MLPRDQFQIFGLENFDGPLCTGGCEKLVYMAEILVTLSVLREPARIFWNKMCSFDVTDFEKTLLVTLYNQRVFEALSFFRFQIELCSFGSKTNVFNRYLE